MIQRLLYTLLTTGFQEFQNNPGLIDELFTEVWELSPTELAGIKEKLGDEPPTIIHGYARTDTDFPAISITLGSEGEALEFIGNDIGMVDEGEYFGADLEGSAWQHAYNIYVYADHPDVCMYYYEMAKSIFLASFPTFNAKGLWQTSLKGMDFMPDPLYVPAHLFVRQLVFSCQKEFCRTNVESRLMKAFEVAGIHIDNSGSPSDVGGVKTNVTTYIEGEDGEA